jgi:hypothetical protein
MHTAGSFKLSHGRLSPFPRGLEPRIMVASDIDGTMIGPEGHGSDAFASSRRFRAYWEAGPALCGSVLAYNTGRSIGQVRRFVHCQVHVLCTVRCMCKPQETA